MYIMESAKSLPQEILDILPTGCVNCPLALYTIERAIAAEEKMDTSPVAIAEDIRENCGGWKDEQSLPENLVITTEPALVHADVIAENCPYSLGVAQSEQ